MKISLIKLIEIAQAAEIEKVSRAIKQRGGLGDAEFNELVRECLHNWIDAATIRRILQVCKQLEAPPRLETDLLSWAIAKNRYEEEVALALLEAEVDVNQADSLGATPLMFAAGVGSTTLISSLLEKNADPGRNDIFGRSAIFWAAERGLYAAIDMLARIAGIETADDCWSKFPASRLDQLPTRLDGCGPGAVVMLKPDRFSLPPDEVWVTEHDGCEREDQLEEEMQRCSSRPMSRPHLIVRLKECFPCLRRSNPLARSLACYSLRPGSNMLLEQAPTCFDDPLFSNVNHDLATCKTRLCIVSADGNDLPCAPGKALETGSRKYLVEIVSILTVEDSYLVKYRSLERRDRQCISCGPTV